jgi:prophage protein DUF1660
VIWRRLLCRLFGHRLPAPPAKGDRWGCARCGRLFSWEAFKDLGELLPPLNDVARARLRRGRRA